MNNEEPPRDGHPTPRKVAVALSGGVDSSVAAALLVEQGHDVVGVTMRLWATRLVHEPGAECCSAAAIADAKRVCQLLRIPFHLIDLQAEFHQRVVEYFCDSYAHGLTPNPCLCCNRHIKFGALLRACLSMGVDWLATGHYARVRPAQGQFQLLGAVDPSKDQSYVLYMLNQDVLRHIVFPLGSYSKTQVRMMAAERALPTARKAESQDICFASEFGYRALVAAKRPDMAQPGPILDSSGRVLGQHRGIAFYTVGQRRGLGIAAPQPVYVVEIRPEQNALIVGPKSALEDHVLYAEDLLFVSGKVPSRSLQITAKIRYTAQDAAATLFPLPGRKARVVFCKPQAAIAPGQAVVFYQGDVLLGGGTIS